MTKIKLNLYFSFIFMIVSIIMMMMALNMIIYDYSIMVEWNILSMNSCNMSMILIFDFMSTMFLSIVTFISSMVILYSSEYMLNDKTINRFTYIIMMFVISMMMLIVSPNMISIIVGWDGLGLVSYCLVIYYQNLSSNSAGMLTALMNRIGDVAILMSIAWMLNFGTWNFMSFIDKMNMNSMVMLIVLASFTKSAQIPFSSWLPAAMAAPTPVSALVHSSTLVTAGVYLMIRFHNVILQIESINLLMLISVMTMIMSGISANFEFDLKKIIALSTLSQLGIMMIILMFGYHILAFFHLAIHALFKASLFLCAGIIIHTFNNNQDIRMMGCLCYQMPLTMVLMNISNLSLCGMPFMSGFYSKDLIMETMSFNNMNLWIMILMYVGIGLTSFYSIRLTYFLMLSNNNYGSINYFNESLNNMNKSIFMLTVYSMISGSLFMWLFFNQNHILLLSIEAKMMTLIFSILGIWLGYELSLSFEKKTNFVNMFLSSMWFMKQISTFHNQMLMFNNSLMFQKSIDQGWGEKMGAQGLINLMNIMKILNLKINENNFKIQMISFMLWMFIICLI
uniref:NADH-ubiquinone oxidoreductase chain 5 n=1 Tax=Okanagana noveboracensis TaxID=3027830 RepID=A0A3Q8GDW0_9HEMI|nr:NADH dehydrogenase subunit 5 [Okanagana noveboracensis]